MRLLIIITLILWVGIGNAQDWKKSITAADSSFVDGDYHAVNLAYQDVFQAGYHSPALFYNMGVNYIQMDSLGQAILFLERAKLKKPNNRNIQLAIKEARSQMEEAVIPVEPFFLSEWLKGAASVGSLNMWAFLSLATLFLLSISVYSMLTKKVIHALFINKWCLGGMLAFLIFVLILSKVRSQEFAAENQGVVMQNDLELKVGPDDLSTSDLTIYAGEKVLVMNKIGEWLQVELLNRDKGWLKSHSIEMIK